MSFSSEAPDRGQDSWNDALSAEVERSLVDLEWGLLLDAIARRAVSDGGRRRCLELRPATSREIAELRLASVGEALALAGQDAQLPVSGFASIKGCAARLARHGVASAAELLEVRRLLDCAISVAHFIQHHAEQAPTLARSLVVHDELDRERSELQRCISEEGEIRDAASSELSNARAQVRALRKQMQGRLDDLLRRYSDALQDSYFAEREGRYVLPVRADAPYRVEGIVFGTSGSGSTLYVEPRELGELGNRLRLAEVEVQRQEARVLVKLSERLTPHAEELDWAEDVCVRADLLRAVVAFATQVSARVFPLDEHDVLIAKGARHPLLCLSEEEVVANDLQVQGGTGLLLSGPNAGGKTVALKCLGLFAVMQAAGLPLPAEAGTRVGFLPQVLSDIGDDQSLAQSLSTFSGHVQRVQLIVQAAGPGTVVLIDELMGGTDPSEGAVLAQATSEALVGTGAAVIVTTHYEPLKAYAATEPRWQNAAVGFDFDAMRPTFRVELGRPGASSALTVARRHGLRESIVERATALLPELERIQREEREDLERKTVRLARREAELAEAVEQQHRLNRSLELELQKAKEARRRDLGRESDELRAQVKAARDELGRIRAKLKTSGAQDLAGLNRAIDQSASVVALGSSVDQALRRAPESTGARSTRLEVGARVRLAGMNTVAEVLEPPKKGRVRVQAGAMKLTVSVDELSSVGPEAGPKRDRPAKQPGLRSEPSNSPPRYESPLRSSDLVLDLRGRRVDESLSAVDSFIDELLRRREFGAYVLHGHGTGALKEAVRAHLAGHACVAHSRAAEREEGGDAHTVFWLQGA